MDTNQVLNSFERTLKLLGEENNSWTWMLGDVEVAETKPNPESTRRHLHFSYTKGPRCDATKERIFVDIWQSHNRKTYIHVYEYEKSRSGLCNWFCELFKPHLLATIAFIFIFALFLWNLFNLISNSRVSESNPGTYIEAQQVENHSLITITKEDVKERNDV